MHELITWLEYIPPSLVDPEFADDNVVHHSPHFPPGVVITRLCKLKVSDSQGLHLQILPWTTTNWSFLELGPILTDDEMNLCFQLFHPWNLFIHLTFELASHGELLPTLPPVDTLAVLSHHGRMMKNLLSKASPAIVFSPVTLECLVQQRIEWFTSSDGCGTKIKY